MNQVHLRRRLGAVGPQTFQRTQNERLVHALSPSRLSFNLRPQLGSNATIGGAPTSLGRAVSSAADQEELAAHRAGANVLAIDRNEGRFLISGGADATVRLWDLENRPTGASEYALQPNASLTRSTP